MNRPRFFHGGFYFEIKMAAPFFFQVENMMTDHSFDEIFTNEVLTGLFPGERSDQFFEALFGDASEGAYDIELKFKQGDRNTLRFDLQLRRRRNKCLACNLTYGLPQVFTRHPIINIKGLVQEINRLLGGLLGDRFQAVDWRLGGTREVSADLHVVPLILTLEQGGEG